jgi:hypothetical protein
MNRFISLVLLSNALLIGPPGNAGAQDMRMTMASRTLLVAQLEAAQVVPASDSRATGTGTFLLDHKRHALAYELTYQGLASGGAKSITLHNFGRGANGRVVSVLCGEGAGSCPVGSGATLSGSIDRALTGEFDNRLIGEFDSGRMYVEIIGTDGKAEIRGQMSPNTAMVPYTNYVAHLTSTKGSDSKGTGTAVLSEIHLPGGKVAVFYALTVEGASGMPTNASLVAVSEKSPISARVFSKRMALPGLRLSGFRGKGAMGGTVSGSYEVTSNKRNAPLVARLLSTGSKEVGIVVTTRRFPMGEFYGALVPVQ